MTIAVMDIADMPVCLRPQVESAMCAYLPTPADIIAYDEDGAFTKWRRQACGKLRCRQTLGGVEAELKAFAAAVERLAEQYGFRFTLAFSAACHQ